MAAHTTAVILTEPGRSIVLLVAAHRRTGIYVGFPYAADAEGLHWTYHANGRVHSKRGKRVFQRETRAPLKSFKGQHRLAACVFKLGGRSARFPMDGETRKQTFDRGILLPSDQLPESNTLAIEVWIVEPGDTRIRQRTTNPILRRKVMRDRTPWLVLRVYEPIRPPASAVRVVRFEPL